jgi:hypothetical protein
MPAKRTTIVFIAIIGVLGHTISVSAYPVGYMLPFKGELNVVNNSELHRNRSIEALDFWTDNWTSFDVYADAPGTVHVDNCINQGETWGFGDIVRIDHYDGLVSYFTHMGEISVTAGQYVMRGERIGASGKTGTSSIHLHYEIRENSGGVGCAGVYSGQSVKIDDHPQIDLESGKAMGDSRAYFPPAPPPGTLEVRIPDYAVACDIPIGPWGTCYDPETGRTANCGVFGVDPETGEFLNGNQVCERRGKTCRYVTPDGGVICD